MIFPMLSSALPSAGATMPGLHRNTATTTRAVMEAACTVDIFILGWIPKQMGARTTDVLEVDRNGER